MKTKLPALAAALLLAVPAAPVFADDLLDAVLWDGPSAFPSETATEPEPPPPPVSEPEPAPAPVYPSRSSYSLRSPAPAPTTLPAAQAPAASPSVPADFAPAALSGAVPAAFAPAALSDALPAAVAPAAPAALSGETQIRREIQEMRARADRLEAALGPAAPPKPARPQYDRADWPERARLSLQGAAKHSDEFALYGEFVFPIAETSFDVAIRGYALQDSPNDKFDYISSNRRSRLMAEKRVSGATAWGIWYPFRGAVISPHAGIGLGYEKTTGYKSLYEGRRSWYWDYDRTKHTNYDDAGLTLAGRVGATLTYKRFTLKGEFILTSEAKVLLAEAGLRVWEHLVLNGLVERYDVDLSDSCTAFGGGVTILF